MNDPSLDVGLPPSPRKNARRLPEEVLAIASMALLLAITLLNVVVRYLTDESIAWTEELSVFLMVVLTLAGASAIARRDRHIRIEFFYNTKSPGGVERPRRALRLFGAIVTSLSFLLLAGLFARWVYDQWKFSETSMGLGVPLWWYGLVIPPLCLAVSARAFGGFVRTLTRRADPEAPDDATLLEETPP